MEFLCNGCGIGLQNFRYKCLDCNDFDLCEKCCLSKNISLDDHNHEEHTLVKVLCSSLHQQHESSSVEDACPLEQGIRDELAVLDAMKVYYLNTVVIAEATRLSETRVRELMDKIMSANNGDEDDYEEDDVDLPPVLDSLEEDPVLDHSRLLTYSIVCEPSLTSQWPSLVAIASTETESIHDIDWAVSAAQELNALHVAYASLPNHVDELISTCEASLDFADNLNRIPKVQNALYFQSFSLLPGLNRTSGALKSKLRKLLKDRASNSKIGRVVNELKARIRSTLAPPVPPRRPKSRHKDSNVRSNKKQRRHPEANEHSSKAAAFIGSLEAPVPISAALSGTKTVAFDANHTEPPTFITPPPNALEQMFPLPVNDTVEFDTEGLEILVAGASDFDSLSCQAPLVEHDLLISLPDIASDDDYFINEGSHESSEETVVASATTPPPSDASLLELIPLSLEASIASFTVQVSHAGQIESYKSPISQTLAPRIVALSVEDHPPATETSEVGDSCVSSPEAVELSQSDQTYSHILATVFPIPNASLPFEASIPEHCTDIVANTTESETVSNDHFPIEPGFECPPESILTSTPIQHKEFPTLLQFVPILQADSFSVCACEHVDTTEALRAEELPSFTSNSGYSEFQFSLEDAQLQEEAKIEHPLSFIDEMAKEAGVLSPNLLPPPSSKLTTMFPIPGDFLPFRVPNLATIALSPETFTESVMERTIQSHFVEITLQANPDDTQQSCLLSVISCSQQSCASTLLALLPFDALSSTHNFTIQENTSISVEESTISRSEWDDSILPVADEYEKVDGFSDKSSSEIEIQLISSVESSPQQLESSLMSIIPLSDSVAPFRVSTPDLHTPDTHTGGRFVSPAALESEVTCPRAREESIVTIESPPAHLTLFSSFPLLPLSGAQSFLCPYQDHATVTPINDVPNYDLLSPIGLDWRTHMSVEPKTLPCSEMLSNECAAETIAASATSDALILSPSVISGELLTINAIHSKPQELIDETSHLVQNVDPPSVPLPVPFVPFHPKSILKVPHTRVESRSASNKESIVETGPCGTSTYHAFANPKRVRFDLPTYTSPIRNALSRLRRQNTRLRQGLRKRSVLFRSSATSYSGGGGAGGIISEESVFVTGSSSGVVLQKLVLDFDSDDDFVGDTTPGLRKPPPVAPDDSECDLFTDLGPVHCIAPSQSQTPSMSPDDVRCDDDWIFAENLLSPPEVSLKQSEESVLNSNLEDDFFEDNIFYRKI